MININTKEEKKERILSILMKATDYLTVRDIGKIINASEKSVRIYLKELRDETKNENYEIIVKPKLGIELRFRNDNNKVITINNRLEGDNSNIQRYVYILKILLENRFTYTTQLFAEELYCSKTTINNDLKYVEEWLRDKNVKLIKRPNLGIYLQGEEENLRKALMELYKIIDESSQNNELDEVKKLDCRLDLKSYLKLKKLFKNLDLLKIQDIVKDAEKELRYCFTKEGFINIIMHIAVAICRIRENKGITIPDKTLNTVKDSEEFQIAKGVVKNLEREFRVDIPRDEIAYITLHMLGTKIQAGDLLDNKPNKFKDEQNYYISIAKKITQLIGDVLEEDLEEDNVLIRGLALHLRPTIIRLENKIGISNPLLNDIKDQLSDVFSATWACNSIFQEELGLMINEDEVAYLTLHIASSIERMRKKLRVLIVCSSGIGTSQFIATKIESRFEKIEIIGVVPYSYLNEKLVEDADYIISTMGDNINNFGKEVINVSALLSMEDIKSIEKTISKRRRKSNNGFNNISGIIDESLIFSCRQALTFQEIIKKYGQILISRGYATDGFVENVIQREKKGSTNIGRGIAIPHAEEQFVKESRVAIIKLDYPIKVGTEMVDLLFILCLKFGDVNLTKNFFKGFYQVLNNDEKIYEIKSTNDNECIKKFFI